MGNMQTETSSSLGSQNSTFFGEASLGQCNSILNDAWGQLKGFYIGGISYVSHLQQVKPAVKSMTYLYKPILTHMSPGTEWAILAAIRDARHLLPQNLTQIKDRPSWFSINQSSAVLYGIVERGIAGRL